jgi:hypothetical protein
MGDTYHYSNMSSKRHDGSDLVREGVVDYDQETAHKLKEDAFLTAAQLQVIHSPDGYNVPRSRWVEGERSAYENLTGESLEGGR